jgi:hypothetical protein
VAGHQLIDDHLSRLARRLPADTVDELADGLTETWQHHLAAGLHTDEAARAAIGEFGTPDQITAAFIAQAPGRRTARMLLATGPPIGLCWGASLVTAQVWTWPIPVAAMVTARSPCSWSSSRLSSPPPAAAATDAPASAVSARLDCLPSTPPCSPAPSSSPPHWCGPWQSPCPPASPGLA